MDKVRSKYKNRSTYRRMVQESTDHDILITLVETVKNNNLTVLEKIDDVKQKVQEVNDGISMKVNDHDTRLKNIEKIVQLSTPEESMKKLNELWQWKTNFQFTWKFIITIAAGVGGLVGSIISSLAGLVSILPHR